MLAGDTIGFSAYHILKVSAMFIKHVLPNVDVVAKIDSKSEFQWTGDILEEILWLLVFTSLSKSAKLSYTN